MAFIYLLGFRMAFTERYASFPGVCCMCERGVGRVLSMLISVSMVGNLFKPLIPSTPACLAIRRDLARDALLGLECVEGR